MEDRSLKQRLLQYIEKCRNRDVDYTSCIERFVEAAKGVGEALDGIYTVKKSRRLKYRNILLMTPGQIQQEPEAIQDLEKLIHAFIRMLPFTERSAAIFQFNELFSSGFASDGFQFSELQAHQGRKYCSVERLFDQTEIEILLLKRLQIDEYPYRRRAGLDNQNSENRQNRDSRDKVAAELNMSPQFLRPYLNRLEQGTNLLGHDIKIELGSTGIVYDQTVHPVFLTLNPSEAALLTIGLKRKYARSDQRALAERIADDVYSQLSGQVREKIDAQARRVNVKFPENAPKARALRRYAPEEGTQGYSPEIAHKRASRFELTLEAQPSGSITGVLIAKDDWEYELQDEQGRPILKNQDGSARIIRRDEIVDYRFIGFL